MDIPPDLNTRVLALEKQFKHIPAPVLSVLAMLPEPGTYFATEDRATFLRALSAVCNLVYGEEVHISIEAEAPLTGTPSREPVGRYSVGNDLKRPQPT